MPSRSKTTQAFPARSTRPPVCFSLESFESGVLSQIIEKKRAHSFNGRLGQCCQKAREGRAGGELVTVKESHEGDRKGLEPLVEGFQGGFSADGIAEENREKIDDLVVPETTPRKAYTLADLG